jgi:hypothetical protein
VVVATHVLEFEENALPNVAGSDAKGKDPGGFVTAAEVSDLLGQLVDYGCRVVVFLDGVHNGSLPNGVNSRVKSWVRDLQRRRRVITFVASKDSPSDVSARDGHGTFTVGVLNAFGTARASGAGAEGRATLSLREFGQAVERNVQDLTDRKQESGYFLPPGVPEFAPFAAP